MERPLLETAPPCGLSSALGTHPAVRTLTAMCASMNSFICPTALLLPALSVRPPPTWEVPSDEQGMLDLDCWVFPER
jgi:hypothetical protein